MLQRIAQPPPFFSSLPSFRSAFTLLPPPPPSAAPPVAGFFQKDRVNEKGPGTRCYKAPELCLRYDFYGYAVDLWAFGCMFGSMIFLEHPLIRGKGSWFNQLLAITKVRRWLPLPVLSCP